MANLQVLDKSPYFRSRLGGHLAQTARPRAKISLEFVGDPSLLIALAAGDGDQFGVEALLIVLGLFCSFLFAEQASRLEL